MQERYSAIVEAGFMSTISAINYYVFPAGTLDV